MKRASQNRAEYTALEPSEQRLPPILTPVGYSLRILCAFLLVFAYVWLAFDAFRLDISASRLFIVTLAAALPILLMCISRKSCIFCAAIIIIAWIVAAHIIKTPLIFISESVTLIKASIKSLFSYGVFNSFDQTAPTMTFDANILIGFAAYAYTLALSILTAPFTVRRVRPLMLALVTVAAISPAFIFNLCRSPWPFAIMTALLAGFVILYKYERSFYRRKNLTATDRAVGGFTLFAAAVIAFAILVLPSCYAKKPWWKMEFFYDRVTELRAAISSGIEGEDGVGGGKLMDGGILIESLGQRSATAIPRSFTGQLILRVTSKSVQPVYLRSWIGIDYSANCWSMAGASKYEGYTDSFGADFMPESISLDCFDGGIDVDKTALLASPRLFDRLGFVASPIDVEVISSAGYMLCLPTRFDCEVGLLREGGSIGEDYGESWSGYFEGVAITGMYNFYKTYRTLAYLPVYGSFFENANQIAAECRASMTAEQSSLATAYTDFVHSAYLSTYENDVLDAFITENLSQLTRRDENGNIILRDSSPEGINAAVMETVSALGKSCRYTLSPSVSNSPNAIEAFLYDRREGYCVQFATASAMLLRRMGVPSRYAEGYIAADLVKKKNDDIFTCDVTDKSAHAWIEVYIEPFGWMQYETTPEYYDDAYRPAAQHIDSENDDYDDIEESDDNSLLQTNQTIEYDDDIGETAKKASINASVVVFVFGAIFAAVMLIRYISIKKRRERLCNANFEAGDEQRRAQMREIHREVRLVLRRYGFIEGSDEHFSEFADRLDRASSLGAFGSLPCSHRQAFELFRAAEFGVVPCEADCKIAASYLSALLTNRKERGDRTRRKNQ